MDVNRYSLVRPSRKHNWTNKSKNLCLIVLNWFSSKNTNGQKHSWWSVTPEKPDDWWQFWLFQTFFSQKRRVSHKRVCLVRIMTLADLVTPQIEGLSRFIDYNFYFFIRSILSHFFNFYLQNKSFQKFKRERKFIIQRKFQIFKKKSENQKTTFMFFNFFLFDTFGSTVNAGWINFPFLQFPSYI